MNEGRTPLSELSIVEYVRELRSLTKQVLASEKDGFWSDWTKAEQEAYELDNWLAFSIARGYTEEEIEVYGRFIVMMAEGKRRGINPYKPILDLTGTHALGEMEKDTRGEIMKSSRIPKELREGWEEKYEQASTAVK